MQALRFPHQLHDGLRHFLPLLEIAAAVVLIRLAVLAANGISNGKHLPEYERYRQLSEELQEELASGAYLEDKILAQRFICDSPGNDFRFRIRLRSCAWDGRGERATSQ